MDFGNWLQEELNKREWSHSELARRCNVAPTQISRIVAGKRGAGPDMCIAIAKGLDLPRAEIFQARGWLESDLQVKTWIKTSAQNSAPTPALDPAAFVIAKQLTKLPTIPRRQAISAIQGVVDAFYEAFSTREQLIRRQASVVPQK